MTEVWCSDELAAVVSRSTENSKSGHKTSTAMTSLQRQEPDAALFQIPPDYVVSETAPDKK